MKAQNTTMKAVHVNGYGSTEHISIKQLKKPIAKDNEIIIKNFAATVTRADTMMLSGKPYFARLIIGLRRPKHPIPGTGYSGVIESVGKNVSLFNVGDHVFGETIFNFSANAEYIAIKESEVILHKPGFLTDDEAATVGDGPVTSYNFLKLIGNIKPGQKVLINGASGALGTAAVQIAKSFGAEVTGVCSSKNIQLVKNLGAHHVIPYDLKSFEKSDEDYDLIFDTVGKSSYSICKSILKTNGQYLSPVLNGRLLFDMFRTRLAGNKKAKFAATGTKKPKDINHIYQQLIKIYEQFEMKTIIDKTYPIEEAKSAHEYVNKGHKVGNIVIQLNR